MNADYVNITSSHKPDRIEKIIKVLPLPAIVIDTNIPINYLNFPKQKYINLGKN